MVLAFQGALYLFSVPTSCEFVDCRTRRRSARIRHCCRACSTSRGSQAATAWGTRKPSHYAPPSRRNVFADDYGPGTMLTAKLFGLAARLARRLDSEVPMNKASTWIVLTVVVSVTGSALALMNDARKSSHHVWCAPSSGIRHQAKSGHS